MFLTRHCFSFGVADYAVLVLRWRIDRVESKVRTLRCVDDIMLSACGDDDSVPILDTVFYAVNDHLSFSSFKSEELIDVLVCLFTDFFSRLDAHEDELTVLSRVQHTPEICVLHRLLIKNDHVSFHVTHIGSLQHSPFINLSCIVTCGGGYLGNARSELSNWIPPPND
jgi:hypothetical protein